jgi:hypothetical protein
LSQIYKARKDGNFWVGRGDVLGEERTYGRPKFSKSVVIFVVSFNMDRQQMSAQFPVSSQAQDKPLLLTPL